MEILKNEWIKLGKKKLFCLLSLLLLMANLLTVYAYEKYTDRFFYVHEQQEKYCAFLNSGKTEDPDGFYRQDTETQKAYLASYPVFIDGMGERVERMQSTALYRNRNSYVYRNLLKTREDFAPCSDLVLQPDNCFGIRAFVEYRGSVLFVLVFLAILTYYILFYERDMNLLLLLKGSKKGHTPLAAVKLSVMVLAALLYTALLEGSMILFLGWMYGYGSLARAVQAVSLFRNCTYRITVGEMLLGAVLLRAAIAGILAMILYCIGMLVKNEITAAIVAGTVLGLEYFFSRLFSISGFFGGIKCVNPFYCWDIRQSIGEYFNLNCLGYPVEKNLCSLVAAIVLALILCAAGIVAFNKTCQVKTEGRLEILLQWLRGRFGFLSRHLGLLYYEFYKMLIQQKKGIVLALLLIWGIFEVQGACRQNYYATAREASYHYYIRQIQGPVTEKTFSYMKEQKAAIKKLWEEMQKLDGSSREDEIRGMALMSELERYEDGSALVWEQLDQLKEKPGDIREKYVLDEMSYMKLWQDTGTDIFLWFVGSAAILYFISGIYTVDEKKKMLPLLQSMRHGRERLNRNRNCCAALCTSILFLLMELPLFLRYLKIDRFATAEQKLCDFTMIEFSSHISLGDMVLLVFLLKACSFFAVCFAGLKLSKAIKGELPAMLTGIGIAGMIAMTLFHFGWDINMAFIKLL